MVTEERGQRTTTMMVREVDRRETADAVKRLLRVERCCGESSSTGRGRTRPLNRILEGCQNVRRARFGLPVSKMSGTRVMRARCL